MRDTIGCIVSTIADTKIIAERIKMDGEMGHKDNYYL